MNKCEQCGTTNKELRPYGPNGTWICFSCGMSPALKKQTEANFISQLESATSCGSVVLLGEESGPRPLKPTNIH